MDDIKTNLHGSGRFVLVSSALNCLSGYTPFKREKKECDMVFQL